MARRCGSRGCSPSSYISLYRLHIWALHGFRRMAPDALARSIRRQTEPKVKLH